MTATAHCLEHFVQAQDPVYRQVCAELADGQKTSHWMWFVFPQHVELGYSTMARRFGIHSRIEAQAYWQHAVLGPRLRHCLELLLGVQGKTAFEILGTPDDLKLRSCLTLFANAVPDEPVFTQALTRFFHGKPDTQTLDLLHR